MGINKDQVEGRTKEATGKVQESAGKMVGSAHQEAKGKLHKDEGAAQAKVGDIREDLKNSAKHR